MQWESILTNATVHRTVAPGFDTLAGVRSPELVSIPAAGSAPKNKRRHPASLIFWSRVRESNPPPRLGKPMYYRCTNPANRYLLIIADSRRFCNRFFCRNRENCAARPGMGSPGPGGAGSDDVVVPLGRDIRSARVTPEKYSRVTR